MVIYSDMQKLFLEGYKALNSQEGYLKKHEYKSKGRCEIALQGEGDVFIIFFDYLNKSYNYNPLI